MSQLKILASLVAVGAMSATLLVSPAQAEVAPDIAVTATASQSQSQSQVMAHWTPERLRNATEASIPAPRAGAAVARPTSTRTLSVPGSAPAGAMAPYSGAGSEALTPFSASKVWADHGNLPAASIGRLYYTGTDGKNYFCSATVISSANRSTIFTAGHCVTDGAKHWYTNFLFAPDYHDGTSPYGTFSWRSVTAPQGYFDGANYVYDMAAIALTSNSSGRVGDIVGTQGFHFGSVYDQTFWTDVRSFGYPEDTHPPRSGINSEQLRYCVDSQTYHDFGLQVIDCDMGHGSSGGPWLYDLPLSRGWGYLVGVNSHHNDPAKAVEISPPLDDAAINIYNAVQAD